MPGSAGATTRWSFPSVNTYTATAADAGNALSSFNAPGSGLAVILPVVFVYNRLVADRNLARQGYADIDVQLKRRADLVPQLVSVVQGYAAHERQLFIDVAEKASSSVVVIKLVQKQ